MRWWPWTRRKLEEQKEEEASVFRSHDLDLEEQFRATANVMTIREAINMFLAIVKDHREDGHDCPPFCVPTQLAYFLQVMDDNDLRMMLTVLLKDMVDNYLRQEEEA
jgi:hypothetical protein